MTDADRQNVAVTIDQAADLLNVSTNFVAKLLDERRIVSRGAGSSPMVLLEELLNYKCHDDARRHEAADELTRETERLGLDY